jgi:rhodanese-related sulfurtransferase
MRESGAGTLSIAGRTRPPTSVEQLLAEARRGLVRMTPTQAHGAMRRGALLVDIRGDAQRERDGVIPGARFIPRNVLEWRCDPASVYRDPELGRADAHVMLICDEGYQSSLAAATLQQFGLRDATDVIGGFQAWRADRLPVSPLITAAVNATTSQRVHQQKVGAGHIETAPRGVTRGLLA